MRRLALLMVVWIPTADPLRGTPDTGDFTDFTAAAVVYILLVGVLVVLLLIGAFMVINLGLMSRRPEDRVGVRTPSDLGILRTQLWPQEPVDRAVLPASDEEGGGDQDRERKVRDREAGEGGPEAA